MSPAGAPRFSSVLTRLFAERDAGLVDVPILQPADPYLETTGEALRRRIFLTRGESGEALCLRPDFTLPVCRAHIAAGGDLPRRYAYLGLVFRQNRPGPTEFVQAGIEDLGTSDRALADARSVADALAALEAFGVAARVETVIGDQRLFEAMLAGLGLPDGWQRRLIRTFGDDALLGAALDDLARHDGEALEGLDPELHRLATARDIPALAALVRAQMETAGLSLHTGRTADEIARRLVEKVAVAEARLTAEQLDLLRAFLAIDCPLAQATARLTALAAEAGLDFGPALAAFEARNGAIVAAGLDLKRLRYRAAFGRAIDYYTGLVFEMRAENRAEPVAGGGRYDRLLAYLGAPAPIPAVGFALWLDRIEALAAEAAP